MTKNVKSIVIDASVARSAGVKEHPTSTRTRHFLEEFMKSKHLFVMTPEIRKEWDKHQSILALTFRRRMVASKRMVPLKEENIKMSDLRNDISQLIGSEGRRKAIEKDLLLLEAALASDNTVVSCDDKIRTHLCTSLTLIKYITDTIWVNPVNHLEESVQWIRNGALSEHERTLGFLFRQIASD